MILILSPERDVLAKEISKRLLIQKSSVHMVSEDFLYTKVPFAFERNGSELSGFLQIDGEEIALQQISGVVIRFPRLWWPSMEFDLQDQMFIYHETTAAWFALLSALACPIINCFPTGWWLHDTTYPDQLCQRLANLLGINVSITKPPVDPGGRLLPTPTDTFFDPTSVYVVGEKIIPRTSEADLPAELVSGNLQALSLWQRENSILLCRLDWAMEDQVSLKYVETFPVLDHESHDLVSHIGKAVSDILT